MTIWKPSTCSCVLHVEQEKVISACSIHEGATFAEVKAYNIANKIEE